MTAARRLKPSAPAWPAARLRGDFRDVPLAQIERDPDQPRTEFDEAELEELAISLREHGQQQPVRVYAAEEGRYRLISGERRWRAAQRANLVTLTVQVVERRDETELRAEQFAENHHRRDLTPLERAAFYRAELARTGEGHRELARRLGLKDHTGIGRDLALLDLPGEVQALIASGELAPSTAGLLRRLPDEWQQIDVARLAAVGEWSRTKVEQVIAERLAPLPQAPEVVHGAPPDDWRSVRLAEVLPEVGEDAWELGGEPLETLGDLYDALSDGETLASFFLTGAEIPVAREGLADLRKRWGWGPMDGIPESWIDAEPEPEAPPEKAGPPDWLVEEVTGKTPISDTPTMHGAAPDGTGAGVTPGPPAAGAGMPPEDAAGGPGIRVDNTALERRLDAQPAADAALGERGACVRQCFVDEDGRTIARFDVLPDDPERVGRVMVETPKGVTGGAAVVRSLDLARAEARRVFQQPAGWIDQIPRIDYDPIRDPVPPGVAQCTRCHRRRPLPCHPCPACLGVEFAAGKEGRR